MEIVCEQFNLDKTDIDYQLLDDTLHKLKFFQKYSLGTRLTLLKVSKLVHFNSGDIVFRQGDVGEFLYEKKNKNKNRRLILPAKAPPSQSLLPPPLVRSASCFLSAWPIV